ncbi:hypothetical protein ES703_23775 [subsurface metagenome]
MHYVNFIIISPGMLPQEPGISLPLVSEMVIISYDDMGWTEAFHDNIFQEFASGDATEFHIKLQYQGQIHTRLLQEGELPVQGGNQFQPGCAGRCHNVLRMWIKGNDHAWNSPAPGSFHQAANHSQVPLVQTVKGADSQNGISNRREVV